jgi:hypothetical protein
MFQYHSEQFKSMVQYKQETFAPSVTLLTTLALPLLPGGCHCHDDTAPQVTTGEQVLGLLHSFKALRSES